MAGWLAGWLPHPASLIYKYDDRKSEALPFPRRREVFSWVENSPKVAKLMATGVEISRE